MQVNAVDSNIYVEGGLKWYTRGAWGLVCPGWEGGWLHRTVPALLYTPLQDLQVSPQTITGIPEELVTALVLCWYGRRKTCRLRHLVSDSD